MCRAECEPCSDLPSRMQRGSIATFAETALICVCTRAPTSRSSAPYRGPALLFARSRVLLVPAGFAPRAIRKPYRKHLVIVHTELPVHAASSAALFPAGGKANACVDLHSVRASPECFRRLFRFPDPVRRALHVLQLVVRGWSKQLGGVKLSGADFGAAPVCSGSCSLQLSGEC